MSPKDSRDTGSTHETAVVMKRVDKFIRLLTFQLFFIIALLAYLAYRPQAGRYQIIPPQSVMEGTIIIFDTVLGKAGGTSVEVRERDDAPLSIP